MSEDSDTELELTPFEPEFVARKEAELLAALTNPDPDPLELHPFGGDP